MRDGVKRDGSMRWYLLVFADKKTARVCGHCLTNENMVGVAQVKRTMPDDFMKCWSCNDNKREDYKNE
jgi:hypothetical protein